MPSQSEKVFATVRYTIDISPENLMEIGKAGETVEEYVRTLLRDDHVFRHLDGATLISIARA